MAGLVVGVAPAASAATAAPSAMSSAASVTSTSSASSSSTGQWLQFTVKGADDSTRLFSAGVPGGGTMVTFFQMPAGDGGTPTSRELTLIVEGEAVAAGSASLSDGTMVPSTDDDLQQRESAGQTIVTVTADSREDTIFLLPEQAPQAADPDNQGVLNKAWHSILGWIQGDDDDTTDGASDGAGDATASPTESTSPPTSAPSSPTVASSPPRSASSSPSSSTAATATATSQCEAASASNDAGGSAKSSANAGTSNGSGVLSDGPTAAATFSEQARQAATAKAGEQCTTSATPTASRSDSSASSSATSSGSTTSPGLAAGVTPVQVAEGDWLSGASGNLVGIEKLRGAPIEVAITWADGSSVNVTIPQLQSGGEYSAANWNKSLILTVSPFTSDTGSWAKAASGGLDDLWTQQLQNIKKGWGQRDGQLFLSLGHEMNGNWYDWSVTKDQTQDYLTAFERYRSLQRKILPDALLGQTFNRESNGYDGDSHDLIAKGNIDFLGVDYYNHFPAALTADEFTAGLTQLDGGGGPKGFSTWLDAGEDAGVPIVVPEWDGDAKQGDSAAYIAGMYHEFSEHAGPGAGQVAAETVFEQRKDENNWALSDEDTKMRESAAEYAKLFSFVG